MRNRIATTVLAGIAYLVSPQSAKAQDVYVCDKQQQALAVQVPQTLDAVASAMASGCAVSAVVPRCTKSDNFESAKNAAKLGLTGNLLNYLEQATYNLNSRTITLSLRTPKGEGFVESREIDPASMQYALHSIEPYCSPAN